MIKTASVEIFAPTVSKNGQGTIVKWWSYVTPVTPAFQCDFQPAVLSQVQMDNWGLNDLAANAKKMFLDYSLKSKWPYLTNTSRVRINGTDLYDIRGANVWPRHAECVMVPVQGGV